MYPPMALAAVAGPGAARRHALASGADVDGDGLHDRLVTECFVAAAAELRRRVEGPYVQDLA